LWIVALASCLACVLLVPLPFAATRLPTLLANGPHGRYTWQVRPSHIVYTGDASGVLGGFEGTGAAHPGRLQWTSWTRTLATGAGAVWLDDCTPDCAQGRFTPHKVDVKAFRPVQGHFRRLTLTYSYHGTRHVDRRGIRRIGSSWSYYIVGR
jgi:hypothetical protein